MTTETERTAEAGDAGDENSVERQDGSSGLQQTTVEAQAVAGVIMNLPPILLTHQQKLKQPSRRYLASSGGGNHCCSHQFDWRCVCCAVAIIPQGEQERPRHRC